MAVLYGIFGQRIPVAGILENLWIVPVGWFAHVKILVTNRDATPDVFRLAISVGGVGIANSQYIAYDMDIEGNDSVVSTTIEVNAGDVIRVYSLNGTTAFSVTGIQEDV